MRIKKTMSKNAEHYSIIRDITVDKKRTTKIQENIGNIEQLKKRAGDMDPFVWLNQYVEELNRQDKESKLPIIIKKDPNRIISINTNNIFNIGYLFLQSIYYELGIDKICKSINKKYKYSYNLNDIFSSLIYSRVIFPCSKLETFKQCESFLEERTFNLQHIYRSLSVIATETDDILAKLYKNSFITYLRNKRVLFYDCTNYYFEIEEESGNKKYGKSKENRPNPIVQMGLFMDGDGLPLTFDITPGNQNEQLTMKPLEEKVINDFNLSEFIVCTDAGLASNANRRFNNIGDRKYITTQSIKKLKGYLKQWALDLENDWRISGSNNIYNLKELKEDETLYNRYKDTVFYKERWINENKLEERLIVTYSLKYELYQSKIRDKQIERAQKIIDSNPSKISKKNPNDPKRFICTTSINKDGEVAENKVYNIDYQAIEKERKFDGLYAVCTNLEYEIDEIVKINKRRWEIEECFRITKTDLKARPVYVSRDDSVKAHFTTCFIALLMIKLLDKKLNEKYTISNILKTLRLMNVHKVEKDVYIPNYIRTQLTDDLHEVFNFRTDYEAYSWMDINKTIKYTKR